MNIDIRFANRFSLQKKCSWCAFFCIWLCGIPFVLSNQTTLCPYGHFRVGLEHASYEVNQNVQVVLVKLADRQSFNTRAESLRICAGCKSCACQKVAWASRNSSKFQPKVFPLLQWFDTFRTTNVTFLRPMKIGSASSFGNEHGKTHVIRSFFVENQEPRRSDAEVRI